MKTTSAVSPAIDTVMRHARYVSAVAAAALAIASAPVLAAADEAPLSVGYTLGYMPYVGEKDGKLTGAEGDLLNATAKAMGRPVEAHGMEFPALLAGIQSGRYDVAIGGLSWSKQRAETGAMSDPIYYSPNLILAQQGLKLSTISDLTGHTVGTLAGATVDKALRQVKGVNVHSYPSSSSAIGDLEARRIDALVMDPLLLAYLHKTRPDLKDYVISTLQSPNAEDLKNHPEVKDVSGMTPYMVVWYCSTKARSFCDEANKQIDGWYKSGESKKILTSYGANSDSFYQPPGGIEAGRRGMDRPQDWVAPSASR
ncbi:MAG TPA: ABC transporter substrate-binding protein [Paraburkholderia sp.]|nr:ABC transporter substrate-binding protein [Paraburkholderia sp.]